MEKLLFCLLFFLPCSISKAQNDFFQDISSFSVDSFSEKSTIVYTHFNGCPPCKRMDKEVLSLENVRSFLDSNFVCIEVFGFDSVEKKFRTQYAVAGDPTFLFLDIKGKEVHRIVGYFDESHFLLECRKANTSSNLSQLDSIFSKGEYNLEFLRDYVHAKEKAQQLDSLLIFKYLNLIPDSNLLEWEYFIDIVNYGYYEGIWDQPLSSRYYYIIKQAYWEGLFPDLIEEMRNRLIFSLFATMYALNQNSPLFDSLLIELKNLETGDPIAIKEVYAKGFFVFLEDRYPSFYFEYERAKNGFGDKSPTEVFEHHIKVCQNNDAELNSLAWGIYEEEYPESIKTGIDLIKKAIKIKPIYSYYDTYAALLFKDGNLSEAKKVAKYAIELAKETNKDYSETEKLLIIIDTALLEEQSRSKKQ